MNAANSEIKAKVVHVAKAADGEIEDIEVDLLLEAVRLRYGYDFRNYSRASLKRRIVRTWTHSGLARISDMIPELIHKREFFENLFFNISITVTELFRDPGFYQSLRKNVAPLLKTWPFVKIWIAGCATGEEAYSMSILINEEGLQDRFHIYATDFNDRALAIARDGVYTVDAIRNYTSNYQKGGGRRSFSDYYHARYDRAILDRRLSQNITFANHNLISDNVFGEMQLVLCRNVLIYFNRELQNRVLRLLHDSLCRNGFLCLGAKETLAFSPVDSRFDAVDGDHKIYQLKRP